MLIILLISFCQSTKKICICSKQCHYTCPIESFVVTNSESQFNDYLLSQIKDEKEIELNFYSIQDEFLFYLDLSLFGESKVTIKTLLDSKSIKLHVKDELQPINKIVEIKPNYQIILPDLKPFQQDYMDQRKKQLDSGPESTPVPISVGVFQMNILGSVNCYPSDLTLGAQNSGCNIDDELPCGYRCWSNYALFYYYFKGVKFQLYGTYDSSCGKFDIEIDGDIVQEIDLHSLSYSRYELIYTSNLLEYKEHMVKFIGKGENFELSKLTYWPSLKSRRLNSSDFQKLGNWMKESDGTGGSREYAHGDSTATVEIKCTKFWLYGLKDEDLSNINITFGEINEQINQYSNTRIEGCLIYESTLLPYNLEYLTITSPSTFYLYCLFYEDPEVQTETPYPTQTIDLLKPTPEATPIPTPIPISVGLYQMNPSGSIACGSNKDIFNISHVQELGCEFIVLNHPNAYQCGFRCWTNNGSYIYTFKGVKFMIYGTLDSTHDIFYVSIDGGNNIEVNENGIRRQYIVVYESDILEYGEHTVKITSNGNYNELYKLVYYPDLIAKRVNSTQFSKTGNWIRESDGIGGAREYTNDANAMAKTSINCTKFWVYGTKGKDFNSMKIKYSEFVTNGPANLNCIYYIDDGVFRTVAPFPSKVPSSLEFSKSYEFTQSKLFSYSNHFTSSNLFSHSNLFTHSNLFSSSDNPTNPTTQTTVFTQTKRIIYSNSFSLTYVLQKSVTFSISFYLSNTYSISYNEEGNTYVIISSETNFYSYFPYIIRFLSPSYVATYISITKSIKKKISQEQLIGITCGSASVFFLVLGIIILIVRHIKEKKLIYDEFDDISDSYDDDEAVQKTMDQNDINDQNDMM